MERDGKSKQAWYFKRLEMVVWINEFIKYKMIQLNSKQHEMSDYIKISWYTAHKTSINCEY